MRVTSPTSSRQSCRCSCPAGKTRGLGNPLSLGSTPMDIAEIDVDDDAQVEAFWRTGKEAEEHGRPYAVTWSLEAATVAMRLGNSAFERHPVAAVENGETVGTLSVMLPKLDNTHIAYLGLSVTPARRRQGLGTLLLEHGLDIVREHGRKTVVIEVSRPMTESGPGESAGHALLARHGFSDASVDLHRVLDLPLAADRLDALASEAAPHHRGYEFLAFTGRVPDEHLAGYCHLQEAFLSEAPMGDLDVEPEVWDEARVRERESLFERAGRRERATAALAPDGSMVALTEMMTTDHQPDVAWQSGTLVLEEHRGHRLG